MERPRSLIRLLLLATTLVQANANHGRLHLTGCQPIEEFTELDQCHCNVGDRLSFSVSHFLIRQKIKLLFQVQHDHAAGTKRTVSTLTPAPDV